MCCTAWCAPRTCRLTWVVCHDYAISAHIPDPEGGLTHYEHALELALARDAQVPTRWSDAATAAPSDPLPSDPEWSGGAHHSWGSPSLVT
jgi:hypothetical protein